MGEGGSQTDLSRAGNNLYVYMHLAEKKHSLQDPKLYISFSLSLTQTLPILRVIPLFRMV